MKPHKHFYPIRCLLELDQFLNVFFGWLFNLFLSNFKTFHGPFGYSDETISSVLGKIMTALQGKKRKKHFIVYFVSKFLDYIDTNHVYDAMEIDEGWAISEVEEFLNV